MTGRTWDDMKMSACCLAMWMKSSSHLHLVSVYKIMNRISKERERLLTCDSSVSNQSSSTLNTESQICPVQVESFPSSSRQANTACFIF